MRGKGQQKYTGRSILLGPILSRGIYSRNKTRTHLSARLTEEKLACAESIRKLFGNSLPVKILALSRFQGQHPHRLSVT